MARDFVVFSKFFNGLNRIKIKPTKLLIKKRGYRKIFSQKLFIEKLKLIKIFYFSINLK